MRPRAVALGVVIRDGCVLAEEQSGTHSKGTGTYYRPIGGTIEFGERSADTVVREFREEIGAETAIHRYLTCLENIFSIDGQAGHELVQVYEVRLLDERLYAKESFSVVEGDRVTIAKWIRIEEFCSGTLVLYPDRLPEILAHMR